MFGTEHCWKSFTNTRGTQESVKMAQEPDNPDRDLSADHVAEQDPNDLRFLLRNSEVAEAFDEVIRKRVGEFISQAMRTGH